MKGWAPPPLSGGLLCGLSSSLGQRSCVFCTHSTWAWFHETSCSVWRLEPLTPLLQHITTFVTTSLDMRSMSSVLFLGLFHYTLPAQLTSQLLHLLHDSILFRCLCNSTKKKKKKSGQFRTAGAVMSTPTRTELWWKSTWGENGTEQSGTESNWNCLVEKLH